MMTWNDIKKKILFKYKGDWKNVLVDGTKQIDIKEFLEKEVLLNVSDNSPDIFTFTIDRVTVYFYLKSRIHFDFNPADIQTMTQWTSIINFLQNIAKNFKCDVYLNHEGGDETLISISSSELKYYPVVYEMYK